MKRAAKNHYPDLLHSPGGGGHEIKGKTFVISGFGNVAWGVALKINELGAAWQS